MPNVTDAVPGAAHRWTTAIVAAIGVLVVAQSGYRAAHQAIAHDEACTYNWFIAEPANVFNYDPNNHVLATYLEMASVAALGANELTLRLPTLLAALLYAGAVVVFVRIAVPSPAWAIATGALLLLNPLVLDYLTEARGYGLALAFLLSSLDFTLLALLARPGDAAHARRWWLLASLALGLCVASSLAFLIVAVCLATVAAAVWWALGARANSAAERPHVPMSVPVPAVAVVLAAYLPLVVKVLVSHAAARWPDLARQLLSGGALTATTSFSGALPRPAPWLVIVASAPMVALACAVLLAVARHAARSRDAARQADGPPARLLRRRVLIWVVFAAALAIAASTVTVASRLAQRYLYVGTGNTAVAAETWFAANFMRERANSQEALAESARWSAAPRIAPIAVAVVLVALLLVCAHCFLRQAKQSSGGEPTASRVAALLLAGTASSAAVAYLAAHLAIGLHYPPPRAAVSVPPLAGAALALVLYNWRRRPRAVTAIAALLALAVVARYVQQWLPDRFWGDTFNANSRAVFERISALAAGRGGPPVRVGGRWVFEPSMNFYRQTRHASWMEPYERVSAPSPDDYDYFVCDSTQAASLERQGWTVAYRDPIAGVRLMARAPPSPR
jgi:hypothetical protein